MTPTQKILDSFIDIADSHELRLTLLEKSITSEIIVSSKKEQMPKSKEPSIVYSTSKFSKKKNLENNFCLNINNYTNTRERLLNITFSEELIIENKKPHALFIDMLWSNGFSNVKDFFHHTTRINSNLSYALNYSNESFPKGFLDSKIIAYNNEKNWRFYLDCFSENNLFNYFSDESGFQNFQKSLISLCKKNKISPHIFLNYLSQKVNKIDTFKGFKDDFAHLIWNCFNQTERKNELFTYEKYLTNYPLLKKFKEQDCMESLFQIPKENVYIQKLELSKAKLSTSFFQNGLKYNDYINYSDFILESIKKSKFLKDNGIIECESLHGEDNIKIFLTIDKTINENSNDSFYKDKITDFYIHIMNFLTKEKPTVQNLDSGDFITKLVGEYDLHKSLNIKQEQTANKKYKI